MKTNKFLRIASVLLIAVLLSTCVISGTFAKYVSSATSAESTARVAKWSFTVGGTDIATSNSFAFNLFNTVKDTDSVDDDKDNDADVKDGVDEVIIAPGTEGTFSLALVNASEVSAEYVVDFNLTNANEIPLEFQVNGGAWGELADITDAIKVDIGANSNVVVNWRWVYEAVTPNTNADDTALGINGTYTAAVTATVTATQVD